MGNRIKELRVNANLTVRELSKITKIDYSYLSKIEKNDRNLTDEMALRIANFFSVDSGYVKGDNNYTITCYTNNLAQSICLTAFDIKHYGHCYTSKISLDNRIINILNRESEKKILKDRESAKKLLNKLWCEKEIIDSMDDWAPISLMMAQDKISKLLNKKR